MENLTSRRKVARFVTNAIKRGILQQIVSFNLLGTHRFGIIDFLGTRLE
jgi:hypothetical protein